jgi:hypothetical protein
VSAPAREAAPKPAPRAAATQPSLTHTLPPPEWFLHASEQLGDVAIAAVDQLVTNPVSRLEALLLRLEAHPDHEKLHQRVMEAARDAARMPKRPRRVINFDDPGLIDDGDDRSQLGTRR